MRPCAADSVALLAMPADHAGPELEWSVETMKKVLVIGSSGLLGSHLVKALQGKAEVAEAALNRAPLKVDIADPASLKSLFQKVGPMDAIACIAGMVRFVPWANASDDVTTVCGLAEQLHPTPLGGGRDSSP
jgi:uncharacterized protein YbjT (DUF2867 family)